MPRLPIRARNVRVFSSTETDPELMGEAERKKLEVRLRKHRARISSLAAEFACMNWLSKGMNL